MALFRKQSQTSAPLAPPDERAPAPPVASTPPPAQPLFNGSAVDFAAIYRSSRLPTDDLDRVARANELLHALPANAPQSREVVEATLRAFGVDHNKILSAGSRQLDALEAFVRFSHEQTERVITTNGERIAELEAEIARCRQISARATTEGDDRARSVNEVMITVQRVIEFFGDTPARSVDIGMDDVTALNKLDSEGHSNGLKPPPLPGRANPNTSA